MHTTNARIAEEIERAVEREHVDYADIRWEENNLTDIVIVGDAVEQVDRHQNNGGAVRAAAKGGWGFAAFNDPSTIRSELDRAIEMARLSDRSTGHGRMAHEEAKEFSSVDVHLVRCQEMPLAKKVSRCREWGKLALATPDVKQVVIRFEERLTRKYFGNSEGENIHQENSEILVAAEVIARDGSRIIRDHDQFWAKDPTGLDNQGDRMQRLASMASAKLRCPKIPAGSYNVMIAPDLCGLFVHEAFGHLAEADVLFESEDVRQRIQLGQRVGGEGLNIVDDGEIRSQGGYYHYDDEGIRLRRTDLVRKGRFVGRLHSRETAGLLQEPVTGNGWAMDYAVRPLVRMTCTFIEPGELLPEQLRQGLDSGIYLKGHSRGKTDGEQFTFVASEAYQVHHGRVEDLLGKVVLSGNVFETLENIEAIANDLGIEYGLCTKKGQRRTVAMGGPHLCIRDMHLRVA